MAGDILEAKIPRMYYLKTETQGSLGQHSSSKAKARESAGEQKMDVPIQDESTNLPVLCVMMNLSC